MKAIVYMQDNGVMAIIHPTPEAIDAMGIEAIAAKDVPTGKPYKIMSVNELPQDRTNRMGWAIDEKELTDGVGA